ncbi:MAG: hypothetical protein JO332_17985 [Planctomycetaceae bacterium]|nr:hypothetical protein [Planctomycetaceae bacterium]
MRLSLVRPFALIAVVSLLPACGSVQVREDQPHVMSSLGLLLPDGAGCTITVDVTITQPPDGLAKKVVTRVLSGKSVTMGNGVDFDLREKIKIVATVVSVVGNCPDLHPGDRLVFEDTMTRQANGTYEADLSKFKLVAAPR